MSAHIPSAFNEEAFLSRAPLRSCELGEIEWQAPRGKPSFGDSLAAGAFLLAYVAAYMAAGRAGIALLEWAWVAIFR
jgi:hypothetical protein